MAELTSSQKRELTLQRQTLEARLALRGTYPEEWDELPLTRAMASELGLGKYFTAIPCRSKKHISPKYTGTGECIACRLELNKDLTAEGVFRERYAKRMATDPDFAEAKRRDYRAYYHRNKDDEEWMEQIREKNRAYQQTEQGKQKAAEAMQRFVAAGKKTESDARYAASPRGQQVRRAARARHREKVVAETGKSYSAVLFERNPQAKLRSQLNTRIRVALKREGLEKQNTTAELIGCRVAELREHLEANFLEGMSWENYGRDTWHIDHIRPCASFDLSDEAQQLTCFNWRNLLPLAAEENISKADQYDPEDEADWAAYMRELGFEGDLFLLYS